MSSGYVIPLDPVELASRFSDCDPRDEEEGEDLFDDEEEDVSIEEMQSYFADSDNLEDRIKPLLDRIPEREADLILMYFVNNKRQADIAAIFGVTQAAISYRLDRGIKRIKFLLSIPQVSKEDLMRDLPLAFSDHIDVDILVGMWETTCQS